MLRQHGSDFIYSFENQKAATFGDDIYGRSSAGAGCVCLGTGGPFSEAEKTSSAQIVILLR